MGYVAIKFCLPYDGREDVRRQWRLLIHGGGRLVSLQQVGTQHLLVGEKVESWAVNWAYLSTQVGREVTETEERFYMVLSESKPLGCCCWCLSGLHPISALLSISIVGATLIRLASRVQNLDVQLIDNAVLTQVRR